MKKYLFAAALTLLPLPALAELEFCNDSDTDVLVAIGYKGSEGWTSEGWWRAKAGGGCTRPVKDDLTYSHYYWYASGKGVDWDHSRFMFCTQVDPFTIVGDEDCGDRGFNRRGFNEIEVKGRADYRVTFGADGFTTTDTANPDDKVSAPSDVAPAPAPTPEPEPVISTAPPGTHGEPFTITGILSHCDYYDAGMGCTVLADGWSYVASSYDPTPLATLERLDAMGPNIPLTVSGDMISYDGTEAMITIRDIDIARADQYQPARMAMQGLWTSEDDANFQVLIHGSTYEELYQGLPQAPLMMHFTDACAMSPGGSPAFNLVDRLGEEDRCLYVSNVAQNSLELFPAGAMKPLYFRREN